MLLSLKCPWLPDLPRKKNNKKIQHSANINILTINFFWIFRYSKLSKSHNYFFRKIFVLGTLVEKKGAWLNYNSK